MKIRKKIIIMICSLTLALSITACRGGSYTTSLSKQIDTKNSMEMYYSTFKGSRYATIRLKKGDKIDINIDVDTKSGSLKISLINKNEEELYSIENPKEKISDIIDIKETGAYKIKIQGEHSGSCKVSWTVEHEKLNRSST